MFSEEIKWIDAPVLTCDRTYFWQQTWRPLLAMASTPLAAHAG